MTVTASAIKLWDAESLTGWTTNKGDLYSGFQREGNYCIGDLVSQTTFHEIYDYQGVNGTTVNLNGKLVTFWVLIWGNPDTLANGGVRFYLEDVNGNAIVLYVGGSDFVGMWWGAGWQAFAVYLDQNWTPNNVNYEQISGTSFPDLTQIAKIGVGFKMLTKAIGTVPNVFWDVAWAIDYIQVTGGTADSPLTFDDLVSADDNNAWGIITEQEAGVYFIQGKIVIGDTSTDTYFVDKNKMIVFKNMWVPDKFYRIDVYRGSANITVFQLGEKSGEAGINGVVIRAPSDKRYVIDGYTNYDITNMSQGDFGIYGSTLINAGNIYLPDSSNAEVLTSSVISSDTLYAYQATIKGCNFISSPTRAVWIPTNHNLSNSNFISNYVAILVDQAGDYTLDAVKFSGNTYDIENASGGVVNINCVNGSNPTTVYNSVSGSQTNIINTVYVTVKVVDSKMNPIQGASVYVYSIEDAQVIMNTTTDENGIAQTTWNYQGDRTLEIHVRKSTPPEKRYIPVRTYGTLTSSGYSVTITLYEDTVASTT